MPAPLLTLTNKISTPVFLTLVSFIITGSLVCNHWFMAPSQTAFFLYTLFAALFITWCGLLVIRQHKSVPLSPPLLMMLLFVLYVACHGLLINHYYNSTHLYMIVSSLLFIAFMIASALLPDTNESLFIIIIIAAAVEALVCLLQYLHLLRSQNSYFAVTGTWVNPNVTATFLAMTIPALLYWLFRSPDQYRKWIGIVMALVIAALYLLKCRTAWAGTALIIVFIMNDRFSIWKRFTSLPKRSTKLLIATIIIIAVGLASIYLYQVKQASADSRLLVWKLSAHLIAQKPLAGYGYGNFEQAYNLTQAAYFKSGAGTAPEKMQAGYVHMAYNEFFQNAIEGGLPGLLLLIAVLLSLLRPAALFKLQQSPLSIAACAGLLAFVVMCIINFTIQAIPVLCLFIIYATAWLSTTGIRKFQLNKNAVGILLLIAGLYFFITQTQTALAQRQNRQAAIAIKKRNYQRATHLLQPLTEKLTHSDTYWQNYGRLLFEQQQYAAAAVLFNKAKAYSGDPNLYMATGYCYTHQQQFAQAEKEFELAACIEPGRLTPRYALLQLYLTKNDSVAALQQAKAIAATQVKVPSTKATQFKKEADQIIKLLTPTNNNNISQSSTP